MASPTMEKDQRPKGNSQMIGDNADISFLKF